MNALEYIRYHFFSHWSCRYLCTAIGIILHHLENGDVCCYHMHCLARNRSSKGASNSQNPRKTRTALASHHDFFYFYVRVKGAYAIGIVHPYRVSFMKFNTVKICINNCKKMAIRKFLCNKDICHTSENNVADWFNPQGLRHSISE